MARVAKFGFWLLLLPLSTVMWGVDKFPTDSHPVTLEEARSLLPAVCATGVMAKAGKNGVDSGCKLCPRIVPGGAGFTADNPSEPSFSLYGVIYGSFTRAGNQEAVASFSGCEPHANNFGGSVLLEKSPQGWKVKNYEAGFISGDCLKYRMPDGRDLLVCRGGYTGQGETDESLFVFDYTLPAQQRSTTLLSTTDTLAMCMGGEQTTGSIENMALRDLNHDGQPDIAVTVKGARVLIPAGHEQDCGANLPSPPAKAQEVDFVYGGGKFHLASWSTRTKHDLDKIFGQ